MIGNFRYKSLFYRGTGSVLRGGTWNNNENNLRTSNRNNNNPSNNNNNIGFRCLRLLQKGDL